MDASVRMLDLLHARRPHFSLQREFYSDPELYALEMEHIWRRSWIFVGHSCEMSEPGRWIRVDIGNDSLIILRDRQRQIVALHNVCRHRGAFRPGLRCGPGPPVRARRHATGRATCKRIA